MRGEINEKDSIISLEQKSEICQNKKIIEENIISKNKINIKEKEKDNINLKIIKTKTITKEFNDEDEKNDINIKYKKDGIKLVAISLDLLLKKIVTDNFLKKNPIKIYSFCQQCFSFIDKEILFNKIFNCYDYYKQKKSNKINIFNLIKFLNILVIEMYEYYYPMIKLESPIVRSLNDFYTLLMQEVFEFINKKEKEKEKEKEELRYSQLEFNIDEFINKLEDNEDIKKDLILDKGWEIIDDKYIPNKETNLLKFSAHSPNKKSKEIENDIYLKTESNPKKTNSIISQNIQNQALNTKKIKLINNKKNESKFYSNDNEINNKNPLRKKGNVFSKSLFVNTKKDLEIKFKNKNDKNDKIEYHIEQPKPKKESPKIRRLNAIKKIEITSPEEEIVTEITNIKVLFSLETKKRELEQTKSKISFYKNIKKLIAESIGKPISESELNKIKSRHQLLKSVTVFSLNPSNKLYLPKNEGFFNILDWGSEIIGEKLISTSKNNINKIQRRELYKAIFLKKDKMTTCPILMDIIEKCNQLTFFIIQDILSYDFSKDRAKIIEKWVTIAQYCKERKDYNDLVAINSALNHFIITGLNRTLKNISKEKKELMKNINKFCRYQGNFKILREDIAKLNYSDFYIPFLGMLLKDLSFFEANWTYIINDTLINFEKLENVQLAMEKFFNFKNTKDKLNPIIPEELSFFDNLENLNETILEELANKLEPKFTLYANKKKEKRKTDIDRKYFSEINIDDLSIND